MSFLINLAMLLAESKDLYTCQDTLCQSYWISDGYCDLSCMVEPCNYDSKFLGNSKYDTFLFSDCFDECPCSKEMLTNNKCDPECDSYLCGWDLGDCGICSTGCFETDLVGTECKEKCSFLECLFNNNNCGWCSEGCYYEDLQSETCKDECRNGYCYLFNPNPCMNGLCSEGCNHMMLGDYTCDYECNNPECSFDYGDCYCSQGCTDISQECTSNKESIDPCDNEVCEYKDGKCGYCASGCFETNLGDGVCNNQCNNANCNYDNGDCGCFIGCSFIYNVSISNFSQIGSSGECSAECLVPECHFAIDFCSDINTVKKGVLNYLVHKNSNILLNLDSCNCSNDSIKEYLDGNNYCESESECSGEECLFCMGKADATFSECVRNSFGECLVCASTMVDRTCQENLNQCPEAYVMKENLSKLFDINLWCLKDAVHYSTSYYKEIYIDPNSTTESSGTKENPYKILYTALIKVYAPYTKIYITSQEIDFFEDESTSFLVYDRYDPLNSESQHSIQELWIIGIFSENLKTKVYWKNNLKLTPLSQKFYLKNLEFIGTYLLKHNCNSEFCTYCPYLSRLDNYYLDDRNDIIDENTIIANYSTTCNSYSSDNILDFSKKVFIEKVDFNGFRNKYNSFIRSSGVLSLINVNFYKMEAKVAGSIILLHCVSNCIKSNFTYNQGLVIDIGAGYDDTAKIATGSFIKSSDIGFIIISNVEFSYNFMLINQLNLENSFLFYSRNHLGTISITDCKFYNNYVNFLIYIDVSELFYPDDRYKAGISLSYSQQHLFLNNIEINNTYCSEGIFYYLMERILHNIKISNFVINNSVIGSEGMLTVISLGVRKNSDIYGESIRKETHVGIRKIYFPPASLNLETITIQNSNTGLNSILIITYPTVYLKDIFISNIQDGNISNIKSIIQSFKNSNPKRYLSNIDPKNELPDLNCNEMISISESVSLKLDSITISKIYCKVESVTSGLFLEYISGSIKITYLTILDIEASVISGIALTIKDSESITIDGLIIINISNLYDSILLFYACSSISVDSVVISNTSTVYSGSFMVYKTNYFTLTNFELNNLTSEFSSGACLNIITGASNSSYKINLGKFTGCKAFNGKGGAFYLDSISTKSETLLEMNKVQIKYSQATEGSAIYISRTVCLSNEFYGSINEITVSYCSCEEGGTISDFHTYGTLKFEKLVMSNNEGLNAGILAFYSTDLSVLEVSNSLIIKSHSKNPLIYLRSLVLKESVYLRNVTMRFIIGTGISFFNLKVIADGLFINYVDQPLFLDNFSELNANGLEISGSIKNSVIINFWSIFICTNCAFINNLYSVLDIGENCYFKLENTSISLNNPTSMYLIYISSGLRFSSTLISSNISFNTLNSGNIIYLISSEILIEDCLFVSNKAVSSAVQGIYALKSVLNIVNSRFKFETLANYGAFIYAISGSKVFAKKSYFENSSSENGNFNCIDAVVEITNCTFSGNRGGDILMKNSKLSIIDTIFEKSVLTVQNTGVVGLSTNILSEIKNSTFVNVSSFDNVAQVAYIYDEVSKQLNIRYSNFIGGDHDILGVYSKQSTSLNILGSTFSEFKATTYSAITVVSTLEGCSLSLINSKLTKNNSKKSGGGAYLQNCNVTIEDSEISYNVAKKSGGGLYFTSPMCNNCGIYISGNSKVFNNSCSESGGGINWKDFKPNIEKKDLIFNNSAEYGSDIASIPAKLGIPHTRKLSDYILGTFSDVPPGKKYTDPGIIWIYDGYDQLVKTENQILVTISINNSKNTESSVSGSTVFKAFNGILNITNFVLFSEPGSNLYLKLVSNGLKNIAVRNDDTIYSDTVYIHVQFRNCTNGEQIQTAACVDCPPGKYTLDASENCLSCPDGAVCTGGDKIIVKSGFWRSSYKSDVIYTCEVYEACLEGNETNELGECGTGYTGVLCQSCKVGYSKNTGGKCAKCPDQLSNIVKLFLFCFLNVFISVVLVKATLTSAFSPTAAYSIFIKIFTNYLHLVFIVTQFNLEWPSYIIELFKVQRTAATVSEQLFSFDCYLTEKNNNISSDGYYTKLCVVAGIPLFIIIISFCYWICHGYIVKSYSALKREFFTTLIVLFFLVYPNIVKLLFSNFSCVPINKMRSYLKDDTQIQCWDSSHLKYSLTIAVPGIIVWALGIPTLILILMAKNKKRLHIDKYRVIFGFFFNGYKMRKFFWELIIMYRKILLITILVFMVSEAIILQALNVIIVLLASLYFQHTNRPYNSTELNNMEMQALCVAAITIYSGLYYLSKSISEGIKVVLFIVIVMGNTYFLAYWIYYMIHAIIDMVVKIFPQYKIKFNRGDVFDEEFYKEEIYKEGVYFDPLERRKAYTFFGNKDEIVDEELNFETIEDAFTAVAKKNLQKIYKKNKWTHKNK